MFAKYHDTFIENYLQTLEPRVLNMERLLPAKTKCEYLIPTIAEVKHAQSISHGV
jgi:hypothetical protein